MKSLDEQLRGAFPKENQPPTNSKPRCIHCNRYLSKCICPPETTEQRAYRTREPLEFTTDDGSISKGRDLL